jgi:hypothetical protein
MIKALVRTDLRRPRRGDRRRVRRHGDDYRDEGKWGFLVAGFFVGIFWLVGSIRLAKPGSYWYRRFYDEDKRTRADARFGG